MDHQAAQRVLIYRIGSMGDTLVSLPCFNLIARTFPRSHRLLLTNFPVSSKAPAASQILDNSDLIHGYMRYSVGTRNLIGLARLFLDIVRFRPDVLVYLMPERTAKAVRRDILFFRLAGVKNIVGLPDAAQELRLWDDTTGLFEKEAVRLSKSILTLGDANPESLKSWDLHLTATESQTALRAVSRLDGAPLLLCAPGTKWQSKDWGLQNWYSLLQKLAAATNHALVLIGSKEESAEAEKLRAAWPRPSVNLCGQLALRETAAVIAMGELFIGPDSGPMHLAAASGVPCAIAFSAQGKPGVWFPVGSNHQIVYHKLPCAGCELHTCVEKKRECLTSISVSEMYEAALAALRCSVSPVLQR